MKIVIEETKFTVTPTEETVKLYLVEENTSVEVVDGIYHADANFIQGVPVSSGGIEDGQVLVYQDGEYVPIDLPEVPEGSGVFTSKLVTLTALDVFNGFFSISTPAVGVAGEKTNVELSPIGGPDQEYGEGFTAMNNDANTALIIILRPNGTITGIASPVYPITGILSKLTVAGGDKFKVTYES